MIPNGTRQNLYSWILFFTPNLSLSFNQNNLVTSFASSCSPVCKNAFSISATNAILFRRNRSKIPVKSCSRIGPLYKHSFRLLFSGLHFADASYTTINLCGCLCWVDNCMMRYIVFDQAIWFRSYLSYNTFVELICDNVIIFMYQFRITLHSAD